MSSALPPPSSSLPGKVSVTVVSGFLGSGKTTLLRRIVADRELGGRVAVIVNDLGELGLDHELIASEGSTPTLHVKTLISGCVCCTLRGDFNTALLQLASGTGLLRRPEHILIEPSGAARASEVSFAVNALGCEAMAPLQTDAVVTLVDAHSARRAHREFPELFEDQLRCADLVVLNKADLLPVAADRDALEAWIAELAPRATRLWSERAALPPQLLLGRIDLMDATAAAPVATPSANAAVALAPGAAPHAHGITARTLEVPFPLDAGALEDWLDALSDRIFRIKGVVELLPAGSAAPPTPHLVQAVGDRVELDAIAADSPLRTSRRRLIFIGDPAALDVAQLARELRGCARGGI